MLIADSIVQVPILHLVEFIPLCFPSEYQSGTSSFLGGTETKTAAPTVAPIDDVPRERKRSP